jgi:predicted methyltransferase
MFSKTLTKKDIYMRVIKLILLSVLMTQSTLSISAEQSFEFIKEQRSASDILRDTGSKGPEIVELVGLKPNMTVLDVLGGGGYYAEVISEKLGENGKVFLHNNRAYMPYVEKELTARLFDNRLENVVRWDRETDNLGFEKQSFDAIFFVLGYHDMYHTAESWSINKDDFLKQLTESLKVGGKLLIIDHSAIKGTGTQHSQEMHRIDAEYVKKEVKGNGYKLIEQSRILSNPDDDRMGSPFSKEMRRKTDRFVLLFEKQ